MVKFDWFKQPCGITAAAATGIPRIGPMDYAVEGNHTNSGYFTAGRMSLCSLASQFKWIKVRRGFCKAICFINKQETMH